MSEKPHPPQTPINATPSNGQNLSKTNSPVAEEHVLHLYETHEKIYPREMSGPWQRLRNNGLLLLLGIYFSLPWLNWSGRQAILFDLPHRRFYLFDFVIWPQDLIILSLALLVMAFTLFFITALAGRIWCGYACPQTIWTEAFIWIERFTEGNHNQQMKLDKMPWNLTKIRKKGGKHLLWTLFSLWTGLTFVGYFTPIRALLPAFFTLHASGAAMFWTIFYSGITYLNAGYLREQFCKTMCPYARFQGAMYDENTLLIAYDDIRGEPRRAAKRGENKDGHCIDCHICVQVCPVGIDIRDGNQYECIGCALCIDACNDVMEKIDAPKNLIRYTSHQQIMGKTTRLWRPKTVGYGLALLTGVVALIAVALNVSPIDINIKRDRNLLFRRLANNQIENTYTVNILNKSLYDGDFTLTIQGLKSAKIEGNTQFRIPAGEVQDVVIKVIANRGELTKGSLPFEFIITNQTNQVEAHSDSRFFNGQP